MSQMKKWSGVVNDFGAGVSSRFTPINSRNNEKELDIGVKEIYQGAWNPVMGFSDTVQQTNLGNNFRSYYFQTSIHRKNISNQSKLECRDSRTRWKIKCVR